MARIRSLKPEAFQSETLSLVSLAAERTFFGMSTIADDRGRLADKPAQINGDLWSMRGNHGTADLEQELAEMAALSEPLVCRYMGCNGKRYLHLVTWDSHQKIDRASKSRQPRCPIHQTGPDDYCGLHEGACPEPSRHTREPSRVSEQSETGHGEPSNGNLAGPGTPRRAAAATEGRGASDQRVNQSSRATREDSMQDLGSRTVDRGSRTVDQETAAPPGALSVTQRSKRLTDAYAGAEPLCKWPAVNGVVIKAIRANRFSDDEIGAALLRLAAENRSVTVDSLRTELGGMPPRSGPAGHREATSDRKATDTQALKDEIRRNGLGAAATPPRAIQGRAER